MNKLLQLMLMGSLVIGLLVTACSSDTSSQNGSNLGRITDYEIDYSQSLEEASQHLTFSLKTPIRKFCSSVIFKRRQCCSTSGKLDVPHVSTKCPIYSRCMKNGKTRD